MGCLWGPNRVWATEFPDTPGAQHLAGAGLGQAPRGHAPRCNGHAPLSIVTALRRRRPSWRGAMSGSNPKAAGAGSTAGPRGLVAGKEEKKKAGGGVLNRLKARRQAPHHAADDGVGAAVTEQELLALDTIRPEHVLRLGRVTESECRAAAPSPRAHAGPASEPARPPSPRAGPARRQPRDVAGRGPRA